MAKHRTYSIEFKRQVAQEFLAGRAQCGSRAPQAPSRLHPPLGSRFQYAAQAYGEALLGCGLAGSMGRRGNPYDCESVGAAWRA
jgi:hypothetical protein